MTRSKLRVSEWRAEFYSGYPEREQFSRRQSYAMTLSKTINGKVKRNKKEFHPCVKLSQSSDFVAI
ncbi:MAG: hypothetical protein J5767_14800 [Paludibacteraceae bacterium]|nr:hypothetical protein [Paludibacteraceae bacterium]